MTRYPPHLNLFGPIHIHRAAADQHQIPHNYCWLIFSKKNPFTAAAFLAAGCWWGWCSDKGPTHLSMVHHESTLDTVLKEIRTPRGFLLLNVFCPIPSHYLSQSSPSSPQSSQVQWQGNLEASCGHTVVTHCTFLVVMMIGGRRPHSFSIEFSIEFSPIFSPILVTFLVNWRNWWVFECRKCHQFWWQ